MEYLHHEWKADAVLGVGSIKGEISSILTLMRWTESYRGDTTDNSEGDLVRSFRYLNEALEGVYDLREVNCITYIAPFHHVIVSRGTSGPLTSAALSSLSKFALYGFLSPHFPGIEEGIEMVAECISGCIFEETDSESDEVIFMKMLELSALTFRCDASSMLSVRKAWEIYKTCLNIHHQQRASKILKSEAESTLRHLTLTTFSRAVFVSSHQFRKQKYPFPNVRGMTENPISEPSSHIVLGLSGGAIDVEEDIADSVKSEADADVDIAMWNKLSSENKFGEDTGVIIILCKIMNSLSSLMDMQSTTQTAERVKFALSLVNIALEAGGPALSGIGVLVDVMCGDMCRHLLRASQSEDLAIFGLALRVVFNLFVSIKDHMKVQLEVYLTSVHLRLLRQGLDAKSISHSTRVLDKSSSTSILAREELALESLLDFCREPSLMCDIYTNYDCDVQCTNLFRTIIDSLCTRAIANAKKGKGRTERRERKRVEAEIAAREQRREVVLNRLALDGVFAVLHAVATRVADKKSHNAITSSSSSFYEEEASERSRSISNVTKSSTERGSSMPSEAETNHIQAEPLYRRSISDPSSSSHSREVSPEVDHIGDQVDAWCSSEAGTPPGEEAAEEEGFFLGTPSKSLSGVASSLPQAAQFNDNFRKSQVHSHQGRGQVPTAQYHPFPKVRSLSYSSSGVGRSGSEEPDQDYSLLHYPEFSGYAHDRVEVEAEVLRERKIKKQNLNAVAQMFNSRPLKPEWLRRALELGCIYNSDTTKSNGIEEAQHQKQQKWDPNKYRNGLDSALAIAPPAAVASFLRNTPGLGKPEIGDFISKGPSDKYPFFADVLQEYVKTFNFPANSGFSEALRTFLGTFRMPGESQCIDRLMEAFSGKLFQDMGPMRPFVNADAAFVLSFSTIILNTDLHNPNLPPAKRMSKDAFIKNNRGINDGKDLPREYLSRLYDEIKAREIQVDMEVTDDGESLASHLSGIDQSAWHRLLDRSAADQAPAAFTPTISARFAHTAQSRRPSSVPWAPSLQDRDMFLVMATPVLQAMNTVWAGPLAGDDLLAGRTIEGVMDYAAICVSLGLKDILTDLVETLSVRARDMMSHPGHLAGLAQSYGDEGIETSLIYLLGPGFEAMLKSAVSRAHGGDIAKNHVVDTASGSKGQDKSLNIDGDYEDFAHQRWRGAHLIAGELVLRALFHIADMYSEALTSQAWTSLLELLLWVRQLGSLSPELAQIDDSVAFWKGNDQNATSSSVDFDQNSEKKEANDSFGAPSTFALECHASAKGLRRTEDGRYRSIIDDEQDSKGLWGAVTGILFGSVTLTEDADTYLQMQQQGRPRKDRAKPLEREMEKEIETLDGNSCLRPKTFLRGHYHRKELLRAALIYSRVNEMLLPSPCDSAKEGQGSRMPTPVHKQPALQDAILSLLHRKTSGFCAQRSSRIRQASYDGGRAKTIEDDRSGEESGYESVALTTDDEETDTGSVSDSRKPPHMVEERPSQTFEIEAVLVLEWAGRIALASMQEVSSEIYMPDAKTTWCRLRDYLLSLVKDQVAVIASSASSGSDGEYTQQSGMQCLYLVERAIGHSLRGCIVEAARSIYIEGHPHTDAAYWSCLAQISSLPRAILMPIAAKFGTACASLMKVAVCTPRALPCLASSLDQWHVLLSLLAAATAGPKGRQEAWTGLCHVLDSRHIDSVSFAPTRLLLLRFLHGAYLGDEEEMHSRGKNTFQMPAMGRLVGLVAMLLGGYLEEDASSEDIPNQSPDATITPKTPTKDDCLQTSNLVTRRGDLVSYVLPKRRDADPSLSAASHRRGSTTTDTSVDLTPVHLAHSLYNEMDATMNPTEREPLPGLIHHLRMCHIAKDDDIHTPLAVLDTAEVPTVTVRAFKMDRRETEHLWLDTVHRLAEIVDPRNISNEVSRVACYNLRAVLAFGSAAQLPLNLWVQVLQDLIARLPLSLLPLAGTSPTSLSSSSSAMPEEKIHNYSAGSCLSACHVILELLTIHIKGIREANKMTFVDPWLKFSVFLAQNAKFAAQNAGSSASSPSSTLLLRRVHDELVDIIIALLQALRSPPDIQISLGHKKKPATNRDRRRAPQRKAGFMGMLFGDAIAKDKDGMDFDEEDDEGDEDGEGSNVLEQEYGLSVELSRTITSLSNNSHDATLLQSTWHTLVSEYPSIDTAVKARNSSFFRMLRSTLRFIEAAKRVVSAQEVSSESLPDSTEVEGETNIIEHASVSVTSTVADARLSSSGSGDNHTRTKRVPVPSIQVRPTGATSRSSMTPPGSASRLASSKVSEIDSKSQRSTATQAGSSEEATSSPQMKAQVSSLDGVQPLRSPMPLPRFLIPQTAQTPNPININEA